MRIPLVWLAVCCLPSLLLPSQWAVAQRKDPDTRTQRVEQAFNTYLKSSWAERRDLMTDRAWHDYAGDALLGNQVEAQSFLADYGVEDYEFPKFPDNYKASTEPPAIEVAIEAASTVRAELVDDLEQRLKGKLPQLLEQLAPTRRRRLNPALVEIEIASDGSKATAECTADGLALRIPMRFSLVDGQWRFDGKDESRFFERLRKQFPAKRPIKADPLRTF